MSSFPSSIPSLQLETSSSRSTALSPTGAERTVPFEESSSNIYELDALQQEAAENDASFLVTYAHGNWDPSVIPEIPLGLHAILGLEPSNTDVRGSVIAPDEGRPSPPDILESVEAVYKSYLETATTYTQSTLEHTMDEPSPPPEPVHNVEGETIAQRRSSDRNSITSASSSEKLCSPSIMSDAALRRFQKVGFLEPPMPHDEIKRRAALNRYRPFTRALEDNLNRILHLAKLIFSVDNAAISLVDTDYTHVTIPDADPVLVRRGESMCSHTILVKKAREPMIIKDTLKDWRFKNNPTVTGAWAMRFYAGQPLRTDDGYHIGTICLIHSSPRSDLSATERATLLDLAGMVLRELEVRRIEWNERVRERVQESVENFSRELETQFLSFRHVVGRMAHHFVSTLALERAFWIDARNNPTNETSASREVTNPPNNQPLAQERHTQNLEEIVNQFRSHSGGCVFNPGDKIPACFTRLLRSEDRASAFYLLSHNAKEPLAIVVVSTSDESYRFTLPPLVLTYFRSMCALTLPAIERLSMSLENKAKIDFIANISHEVHKIYIQFDIDLIENKLRTPLHGVLASCELLKESSLSEGQLALLNTAKSCTLGLSDTLNHVLDFTKVNARISLEIRDTVDLAQLVEETMVTSWLGASARFRSHNEIGEIYAPSHTQDKEKDVEPLIEIEPLENWTVSVDKAGLRRIILNLIGNSLKFTQQGGYVKISLRKGPLVDANTIMVEIVVEDSGCGMSETFVREKLFHPFSQERPLSQGTGLGLALVRTILRSPGVDGTIDVHSKVGVGTRMTIRFKAPIVKDTVSNWNRAPKRATLPPLAICGFEGSSKGLAMAAKNLRTHLEEWYGMIPEVELQHAELLVVDRDHADKATFCSTNTGNPKCLVICSAPVDPSVFKIVREYNETRNFCQILIKPFGPHALAVALSAALDAPMRKQPSIIKASLFPTESTAIPTPDQTQEAPTTNVSDKERARNLKNLRVLVVEDNPVNLKVISTFLSRRGCYFVKAHDGVEGVEQFVLHRDNPFHVCLMDIQMPRKDGFEATREIRLLENSGESPRRRLKIYALTGQASQEDKEKATETGFDGYLVKPFSFRILEEILQSYLTELSN